MEIPFRRDLIPPSFFKIEKWLEFTVVNDSLRKTYIRPKTTFKFQSKLSDVTALLSLLLDVIINFQWFCLWRIQESCSLFSSDANRNVSFRRLVNNYTRTWFPSSVTGLMSQEVDQSDLNPLSHWCFDYPRLRFCSAFSFRFRQSDYMRRNIWDSHGTRMIFISN